MRLTHLIVLVLALLAILGLPASLPSAWGAMPRLGGAGPGPIPEPVRRIVRIDGRSITVEITLLQVIGGAPIEGGNIPQTTAHVTLSVNDGALLPAGLDAVGVRFDRQRGINREINTRLTEVEGADSDQDELVQAFYQGQLPEGLAAQSLPTTIQLRHGRRVIRVPMGTVPVHVLALP